MPEEFVRPNGASIRRLRVERGWTQEQLKNRVGCSKKTIENAEAGNRLRLRTVHEIAQALGVSSADLKTQDAEPPSKAELRLLLIEDDQDTAYLMRKILERAGHHDVTHCCTGAEAVIVMAHNTFDLVLLDYMLPDTNGFDLFQRLKYEGIVPPVVMVTGFGDEGLATRVLQAGVLDYIAKDPALTFLEALPKIVSESVGRDHLKQMNRLLIQALDSMSDGVMITDFRGTIVYVNSGLVAMMGYSQDELLGQSPDLFASEKHLPDVYTQILETVRHGTAWRGEVTNCRQDDSLFVSSLRVSPILDAQGGRTHCIGVHRELKDGNL